MSYFPFIKTDDMKEVEYILFVCSVLIESGAIICVIYTYFCVLSYCSTTATGLKPICS
jgi:hypothetical protein